jgi:hypothetical protein
MENTLPRELSREAMEKRWVIRVSLEPLVGFSPHCANRKGVLNVIYAHHHDKIEAHTCTSDS